MRIERHPDRNRASLEIGKLELELTPHVLSDWVQLEFQAAPGIKVRGCCRLMVTEMGEHFSLYVTPISIDPENPAMPISHPPYYSNYLAKKIGGPYSTLGLAEDTWALNEGVTDDATFLEVPGSFQNGCRYLLPGFPGLGVEERPGPSHSITQRFQHEPGLRPSPHHRQLACRHIDESVATHHLAALLDAGRVLRSGRQ